jgi:hypothetical protein
VKIESQILYLYPGTYKNFDDLEDNLTQEELEIMYNEAFKLKEDEYRFLAALQGIELDKKESEVDAIIRRAEAKALGMSEEQYELTGMFEFVDED